MDSAKQNELIQDLEAQTQRLGPAHPVHNPGMRHVASERTNAVNRGALDEEPTEKPGRLGSPFAATRSAWDKDNDVWYVCGSYRESKATPPIHKCPLLAAKRTLTHR